MSNMCGVLCAAYEFDVLYVTCVSSVLCASCFFWCFVCNMLFDVQHATFELVFCTQLVCSLN